MLILTRRPGESLRIEPDGRVPTEADPFGWFAEGPIRIAVSAVHRDQVRIGIQAPPALKILRDELPPAPARSRLGWPDCRWRRSGRLKAGWGWWSWASSKRWRGPSGCPAGVASAAGANGGGAGGVGVVGGEGVRRVNGEVVRLRRGCRVTLR